MFTHFRVSSFVLLYCSNQERRLFLVSCQLIPISAYQKDISSAAVVEIFAYKVKNGEDMFAALPIKKIKDTCSMITLLSKKYMIKICMDFLTRVLYDIVLHS